jgi:hypothetical protein
MKLHLNRKTAQVVYANWDIGGIGKRKNAYNVEKVRCVCRARKIWMARRQNDALSPKLMSLAVSMEAIQVLEAGT